MMLGVSSAPPACKSGLASPNLRAGAVRSERFASRRGDAVAAVPAVPLPGDRVRKPSFEPVSAGKHLRRATSMQHAGFEHQALIYEGADEYLAGIVPFLWAALEAEEPVLVAVSSNRAELLWEELGGDARWVQFVAVEEAGRNPAGLIPLWRSFVDENGGAVRGISEPIWRG